MKRIIYSLLTLLLVFTACNQQDEFRSKTQDIEAGTNRFYGVKRSGEQVQTKGIAQQRNLWHTGTTIKVKFLNGTEENQQKVKTYAAEWEEYADITFQFVTEGKADVRIGFDWNNDRWITWSYIGTDCKIVTNQAEATMSFADWASITEQEKKGDVLRTFGQVLGLELEHRHLNFDAGWTNRIAEYWEMEIEDIPWQDLKEYVFDPLQASDVIMTDNYDENSIMIWPFHRRYADNTARYANYELSELDKQFIGQLYPKWQDEPLLAIKIRQQNFYNAPLHMVLNKEVMVDWGDGQTETIPYTTEYVDHFYPTFEEEYTIKIYGEPDAINHARVGNYDFYFVLSLEISKKNKMESLYYGESTPVDISNATELKKLEILNYTESTTIDLSKNTKLEYLFYYVNLCSLDLSSCSNIKCIKISSYNPIVSDETALLNLVQTLPDRTGSESGIIECSINFPSVVAACAAKNWTIN